MIRQATKEDLPELLRMGELFFKASGYSAVGNYNLDKTTRMLESLIELGTLLIGEGGMLGYVLSEIWMTDVTVGSELFWWVDEDKRSTGLGLKLIKAAEAAAKENGASYMAMANIESLNSQRMNTLYTRLGYALTELTWTRKL